jgi:hypothetical protein
MVVRNEESGNRPIPDPTVLTTEQLRREVAGLKDLLTSDIEGKYAVIETRLTAMDQAVKLFQTTISEIPKLRNEGIENLHRLIEEKFRGIDTKFDGIATQFKERDTRIDQAYIATKTAVDAALQAQKEAVGQQNTSNTLAIDKTERSFIKANDQLGETLSAKTDSLNSKIDDLRGRLTTLESRKMGSDDTAKKSSENWGFVFGLGGFVMAIISAVILIATKLGN